MQHFWETGDLRSLQKAEQIHTLVASQWDERDGGLPWKEHFGGEISSKVMVSNATAAILAAELFRATCNPRYYRRHSSYDRIPDSSQIWRWTRDNLQARDRLFFDGKGGRVVSRQKYTYGQGVGVGAIVALHKIEPELYPLQDAVDIANATLDAFDCCHARLQAPHAKIDTGDNAYNAILFDNLLRLTAVLPKDHSLNQRVRTMLHATLNKQTALRPDHNYPDLLQQAGALRLALLAYLNPVEPSAR